MGTTEWRVFLVDPEDPALTLDGTACYAVTLTETCEILIARNVPRSRIPSLVVHELLHAAIATSGLGVTQRWSDAREEVIVRGLADHLAHALVGGGLWRGRRIQR